MKNQNIMMMMMIVVRQTGEWLEERLVCHDLVGNAARDDGMLAG